MKKGYIKALALTAAAAVFAFTLAACGSGSSAPAGDGGSSATSAAPTSEAVAPAAADTSAAATEAPAGAKVIRISTTTSVNDSGLLPYLQPYFEEATGYTMEVTSAGTGAAIKKGETGDADALLVHAKASEEEFIENGYGVERVPFMYNYFVIVGPADDPAGIAGCETAAEAFAKIAESGSKFVSRGDDSGTNKKELQLWEAAGVDPAEADWYINAGQGMGATLTMAGEEQAYTLTDKGTYLSHEVKETLPILLGESEDMKNTYTMIAINPEAWPDTNIEGANAFIDWMTSVDASELIAAYGVEEYGEPLFFLIEKTDASASSASASADSASAEASSASSSSSAS